MAWDYRQTAFRGQLAKARTYERCRIILAQFLDRLGFTDFNYGAPSFSGSILSSMDREWIRKYVADGYFRSDKLVLEASKRTSPFRSDEIFVQPPATVRQSEMETAIARHPLGLVIPLHCPLVGFAILAAYNPMESAAFDRFDLAVRPLLTLLAHDFHDHARHFYFRSQRNDGTDALSAREREVLEWSAAGKTASEIAILLQLSMHTINNHLASARRKLGTKSTAAAIALTLVGEWRARPHDSV